MRLYEQFPHAELLVKFAMAAYATSKQILQKTATDKAFCKWLIAHREQLQYGMYYIQTILQVYKTGKDLREIQSLLSFKKSFTHSNVYADLKPLFITNAELPHFHYRSDHRIGLGLDMSLPKNKYSHNFMHWHDVRISQYNTQKALLKEQERQAFHTKFATVANKYLPLQKDTTEFVVLLAKSPTELVEEGKALQHCVGSLHYDQNLHEKRV